MLDLLLHFLKRYFNLSQLFIHTKKANGPFVYHLLLFTKEIFRFLKFECIIENEKNMKRKRKSPLILPPRHNLINILVHFLF